MGAVADAANPAVPHCSDAACSIPQGQQRPQLCFPPGKPPSTGHASPSPPWGQRHGALWQPKCSQELSRWEEDGAAAVHGGLGAMALPEPLPPLPHGAQRCQCPPAPPAGASAGTVGSGRDCGHRQGAWALTGEGSASRARGACSEAVGISRGRGEEGFPHEVWEKGRSQREGGIRTLPVSGVGWWEGGRWDAGAAGGPSTPLLAHHHAGLHPCPPGCAWRWRAPCSPTSLA